MAQMQGGVVQATVTTSTQYSGFEEPMKKWGLGMETSIPWDLKRQKEVARETQKIGQVNKIIGGLQDFCTREEVVA